MLINILINKVYIYQNKAVIVYNVSNVKQEIDLSLINNIECSLVDADALPNRKKLQKFGANIYKSTENFEFIVF